MTFDDWECRPSARDAFWLNDTFNQYAGENAISVVVLQIQYIDSFGAADFADPMYRVFLWRWRYPGARVLGWGDCTQQASCFSSRCLLAQLHLVLHVH